MCSCTPVRASLPSIRRIVDARSTSRHAPNFFPLCPTRYCECFEYGASCSARCGCKDCLNGKPPQPDGGGAGMGSDKKRKAAGISVGSCTISLRNKENARRYAHLRHMHRCTRACALRNDRNRKLWASPLTCESSLFVKKSRHEALRSQSLTQKRMRARASTYVH